MRIVHAGFKCYLLNVKLTLFGLDNKQGFGDGGLSGNLVEMQKGETRNHKHALKNFSIPIYIYFIARLFSNLKYIRRLVIVKIKNLNRC